jgi:septal ring factor EnvC (AmiA/AmiB activator)
MMTDREIELNKQLISERNGRIYAEKLLMQDPCVNDKHKDLQRQLDSANEKLAVSQASVKLEQRYAEELKKQRDDYADKLRRITSHIQECMDCDLCLEESDPKLKEQLYEEWAKLGPDWRGMCNEIADELGGRVFLTGAENEWLVKLHKAVK